MCLCVTSNKAECGASDCVNTNLFFSGSSSTICPECGKPYYYIGDPIWNMADLICDCGRGPGMFLPKNEYDLPSFGWECPRCHKIHAPWIAHCDCPALTFSTNTGNWGASRFPPVCEHDFGEGNCYHEECKFYCGDPKKAREKRDYFSGLARAIANLGKDNG